MSAYILVVQHWELDVKNVNCTLYNFIFTSNSQCYTIRKYYTGHTFTTSQSGMCAEMNGTSENIESLVNFPGCPPICHGDLKSKVHMPKHDYCSVSLTESSDYQTKIAKENPMVLPCNHTPAFDTLSSVTISQHPSCYGHGYFMFQ